MKNIEKVRSLDMGAHFVMLNLRFTKLGKENKLLQEELTLQKNPGFLEAKPEIKFRFFLKENSVILNIHYTC